MLENTAGAEGVEKTPEELKKQAQKEAIRKARSKAIQMHRQSRQGGAGAQIMSYEERRKAGLLTPTQKGYI
eukprot:Pgem_evm1s6386